MGLNKSQGNMYEFVTHTWNTVKGVCLHNCGYCYMKAIAKRYRKPQLPPCFDEKELKTNLGNGKFIFVGSSNDLFAKDIPEEWIVKTLDHCTKFDNRYLFQTKNPARVLDFIEHPVFEKSVVCTTLESDSFYAGETPTPLLRGKAMKKISDAGITTYITIEPIMNFNLTVLVEMIKQCKPTQVNIGADSGNNHLSEPSKEDVLALISELEKFTVVKQKSNLSRLLK